MDKALLPPTSWIWEIDDTAHVKLVRIGLHSLKQSKLWTIDTIAGFCFLDCLWTAL